MADKQTPDDHNRVVKRIIDLEIIRNPKPAGKLRGKPLLKGAAPILSTEPAIQHRANSRLPCGSPDRVGIPPAGARVPARV